MQTDQIPPLATSAAILQIEEGKFYRNRKGEKVGPMIPRDYGTPAYCWREGKHNRIYKNNGDNYDGGDENLIAPWPEIKLAVGQEVETEFGRRGIVEANHNALGNNEHKFIVQYPSRRVAYTESGSYYGDGEESHLDIVRIVSQPTASHEKIAEPAGEIPYPEIEAGKGWRRLGKNELPIKGDQCRGADAGGQWLESIAWENGNAQSDNMAYRRRLESPAPATAASEENLPFSMREPEAMRARIKSAEAERDQLKSQLSISELSGNELAAKCDQLRSELAELRKPARWRTDWNLQFGCYQGRMLFKDGSTCLVDICNSNDYRLYRPVGTNKWMNVNTAEHKFVLNDTQQPPAAPVVEEWDNEHSRGSRVRV